MVHLPKRLRAAAVCVALGGCAADDDHMHMHVDPPTDGLCDTDERADTYVPSLEKVGDGGTVVRLVNATPSPPAKGDNTWTIAVEDGSGNAVVGADVMVFPWMPDHGHGTTVDAMVEDGGDGSYTIAPLNLWMPGLWEITLDIHVESEVDQVTFGFCIEG